MGVLSGSRGPCQPTTLKGQDGGAHCTCRVFSPQIPTERLLSAARSSAPSRAPAARRPRAGGIKPELPCRPRPLGALGQRPFPPRGGATGSPGARAARVPGDPASRAPARPRAWRRSGSGADSQGLQVLELLQLLRVVPPPLLLPAPLQLLLGRLPLPPHAPGLRVVAPRPGRHRGPRG